MVVSFIIVVISLIVKLTRKNTMPVMIVRSPNPIDTSTESLLLAALVKQIMPLVYLLGSFSHLIVELRVGGMLDTSLFRIQYSFLVHVRHILSNRGSTVVSQHLHSDCQPGFAGQPKGTYNELGTSLPGVQFNSYPNALNQVLAVQPHSITS